MNKVIILGSTGSIGRNAIKVIQRLKGFSIVGLAAYSNHQLLVKQARQVKPKTVAIIKDSCYVKLKKQLCDTAITRGEKGILELIDNADADTLVCAFARSTGIHAIIRAIKKRMKICLATKELLVSFGEFIMKYVKKYKTSLIPIDSEHSAVYQCLEGRNKTDVMNIILTASGGPFLHKTINNVRVVDVLNHPVWKMGAKITVDSATLMNKGLEVIEAHHLFDMPADKIKVVIHPEALCHSLVQFKDGSLLAQFSTPDMRLPIQYALTAPERFPSTVRYLDLSKSNSLTFLRPDAKKFRCLKLAYNALQIGKSMPAVLNAANEEAVRLFLDGQIAFSQIPKIIAGVMNKHVPKKGTIDDYLVYEQWARKHVRTLTGS